MRVLGKGKAAKEKAERGVAGQTEATTKTQRGTASAWILDGCVKLSHSQPSISTHRMPFIPCLDKMLKFFTKQF